MHDLHDMVTLFSHSLPLYFCLLTLPDFCKPLTPYTINNLKVLIFTQLNFNNMFCWWKSSTFKKTVVLQFFKIFKTVPSPGLALTNFPCWLDKTTVTLKLYTSQVSDIVRVLRWLGRSSTMASFGCTYWVYCDALGFFISWLYSTHDDQVLKCLAEESCERENPQTL